MTASARIFRNGASQAVRLPKAFRFAGDEVCIKRIGSTVVLVERGAAWNAMADALGAVDADFTAERDQPSATDRRKRL